jgi:hypothetical protein
LASLTHEKKPLRPQGRRRLRWAAAVAVPALSLGVVAASSATPAWAASCTAKYLCTWQNSDYMGTQWTFTGKTSQGLYYWWYVGAAANDQISSLIFNNGGGGLRGWVAKNCPADSDQTWFTGSVENLASSEWPDQTGMNDSISAWAISANTPEAGSRTNGGC